LPSAKASLAKFEFVVRISLAEFHGPISERDWGWSASSIESDRPKQLRIWRPKCGGEAGIISDIQLRIRTLDVDGYSGPLSAINGVAKPGHSAQS
jgi:hypothetical protein